MVDSAHKLPMTAIIGSIRALYPAARVRAIRLRPKATGYRAIGLDYRVKHNLTMLWKLGKVVHAARWMRVIDEWMIG